MEINEGKNTLAQCGGCKAWFRVANLCTNERTLISQCVECYKKWIKVKCEELYSKWRKFKEGT